VSRHHGGLKLEDRARDFAFAVGALAGRAVAPTLVESYEVLLAGVQLGRIDLAWLPPLVHTLATAQGATLAAVCERGGVVTYRSAILVHADAPFRHVRDLAKARAAWTDSESASGYLFPRRHLARAGVDPHALTEKFLGSASAAAGAVADRAADVCACFISDAAGANPLTALAEARRGIGAAGASLRVLDVTDPIPPDGFVLGAEAMRTAPALVEVLLALHQRPETATALKALTKADRLVPVDDRVRAALASV
jgi:phosphonate transport system substrate-binding protein